MIEMQKEDDNDDNKAVAAKDIYVQSSHHPS